MRREDEIYERTLSGSFFSSDVKSGKESDCEQIRKDAFDLAKRVCIEKYNMFRERSSTFKFDKLMTDFERIILIFSEIFGNQPYLYGRTFNHELIDSRIMHELFLPLIKIESMFLDEKQNLDDFLSKSYELLKEISEMIEPIINSHREYETTDFGHADHQPTPRSSYTEPFEESRDLAALLNAVLENKCQQNCDCNHRRFVNGQWKPNLDEIVHKPVVMTPDEIAQVGRFVAHFSKELLK
jgi:hypothetical protein